MRLLRARLHDNQLDGQISVVNVERSGSIGEMGSAGLTGPDLVFKLEAAGLPAFRAEQFHGRDLMPGTDT